MRTLGSSYFALLLQEMGEAAPTGSSLSVVELIAQSTIVSQVVLGLLALMSVSSWAIILYKTWTFQRLQRQSAAFLDVFRRSNKFSEVQAVCKSLKESPLVGLFQSGYAELTAQLRQGQPALEAVGGTMPTPGGTNRPTLKSLPAVDRALLRASVVEVNKLERRIPFLATTASVAPFIGLFGTVWGILIAFQEIGATGSTDLAAVGAPIAEALIATAAGLFAAIPAVYFYNLLTLKVKLFASEMDDFALEFLNIAERNFT
ncbi:MAG: MotA/TolQ/ExbB proton channel family protein [Vicinamibacterales bacterium]